MILKDHEESRRNLTGLKEVLGQNWHVIQNLEEVDSEQHGTMFIRRDR